MANSVHFHNRVLILLMVVLLPHLVAGCAAAEQLLERNLPEQLPEVPGLPRELGDIPGLLDELGLPDISQLEDLPSVETLPRWQSKPGAILFRGPVELRIQDGETIPGTDISLTAIDAQGASFTIANLHSVRTLGDSLDYDGAWGRVTGTSYNLRLRLYHIGDGFVRAAGVHQIEIENIRPEIMDAEKRNTALSFPYTVSTSRGASINGTTYGYAGTHSRGGELFGLPEADYPYRKIGDSIHWEGALRAGISAEFMLRMLYYDEEQARVGGIVTLYLPV